GRQLRHPCERNERWILYATLVRINHQVRAAPQEHGTRHIAQQLEHARQAFGLVKPRTVGGPNVTLGSFAQLDQKRIGCSWGVEILRDFDDWSIAGATA